MELKKYLGETTFYEKKREVERNKVKNWLKTVSAFANGKGGILIFGVMICEPLIWIVMVGQLGIAFYGNGYVKSYRKVKE